MPLGVLIILFPLSGEVEQLLDIFWSLRLLWFFVRFGLGGLGRFRRLLIGRILGLIWFLGLRLILGLLR